MTETVLYVFQASVFSCIGNVFILIMGIVVIYVAFFDPEQRFGKSKIPFRIFAGVVGPLFIIAGIVVLYGGVKQAYLYKDLLDSDKVYEVEGLVENYHCPPSTGHDSEHFDINGVHFEYSYFETRNGYHKPASNGGVITKNGQHLRIKYVEETYDEDEEDVIRYPGDGIEGDFPEGENVILYIAEIKDQ